MPEDHPGPGFVQRPAVCAVQAAGQRQLADAEAGGGDHHVGLDRGAVGTDEVPAPYTGQSGGVEVDMGLDQGRVERARRQQTLAAQTVVGRQRPAQLRVTDRNT